MNSKKRGGGGRRRRKAGSGGSSRTSQSKAGPLPKHISGRRLERLFQTISRSQQGYRELIDSLDECVFSLGPSGVIRSANRRLADVLERPIQEVVGQKLEAFLEEPDPTALKQAFHTLANRKRWAGITRVVVRGGTHTRFFDCKFQTIQTDRHAVAGVTGWARDVTKHRELETKYTGLFESLQEGVYSTTTEGVLLEANPALVGILGYQSRDELIGMNVSELYVDPGDRPRLLDELNQRGAVQNQTIRLRRKDRKEVVCLDTSTAIRDHKGRVVRYQGTLVDISERTEIERRLHQEQEFAKRLIESFPDLIVVLDREGRYTFVSSRIEESLGFAPKELLGQLLGERTDPAGREMLMQMHRDLLSGKQKFTTAEYRTRHKNGTWRILRAVASPLYDSTGRATAVVASARDVTEVKHLEEQLHQSERLAAMGQMIAGVAHELNNPLTAILAVTELLRDRTLGEMERRQVDLAHQQARRAANIVQDLLAFSRPTTVRAAQIDLREVVERSLRLQEDALRQQRISVKIESEPDLSPVPGDPNQLLQVFLNLFANAEHAIRQAAPRSGCIQVRLGRADDRSKRIQVEVEDNGTGIEPQVLPRVFDPFFTTKRPGGGTGLGLSICLAIIREHGGSIEALPAGNGPEEGSIFRIQLPTVGTSMIPKAVEEAPQAMP